MKQFAFRKQERPGWKRIQRTFLFAETGEGAVRLDDVQELELRPGTGWTMTSCAVNLSIVNLEGRQVAAVVRYDTSHGFPHRDELFRDPPEKIRLPGRSPAELRKLALQDLEANWYAYLEQVKTYGPVA